jgi:hypothetical protein
MAGRPDQATVNGAIFKVQFFDSLEAGHRRRRFLPHGQWRADMDEERQIPIRVPLVGRARFFDRLHGVAVG